MRLLVAARLSQTHDGQTGIESQDAETRRWAEAEGHVIVGVVADHKSGTVAPWDRPNLRAWVTDPGKISQYDAVVAYRLDRLSRGDNQSTNDIETWAGKNKKQLLTQDGLTFPCEGTDGIRWDVTARIAHDEWLKASERYKRMQGHLKSQGKLVGRPPFGYEVVPAEGGHKTLSPTETGRQYVPGMFARCINGDSLATICLWLDSEGVTPPLKSGAGKWSPKSVGQIIRNSTMMGRRTDSEGRTILRCEAIVGAQTFKRAGQSLDARPKRGPQNNENRALLAEVLRCAKCKGPMYRLTTGYYRCSGTGPVRKSECKNMILVTVLDEMMNDMMMDMTKTIKEQRLIPGHNYDAQIAGIEFDMKQVMPRTDLSFDEKIAELNKLQAEVLRLQSLPAVPDEMLLVSTGITYAAKWASLEVSERGAWLRRAGVKAFAAKDFDPEYLMAVSFPDSHDLALAL